MGLCCCLTVVVVPVWDLRDALVSASFWHSKLRGFAGQTFHAVYCVLPALHMHAHGQLNGQESDKKKKNITILCLVV